MGLEPGTTKDDIRRCLENWNKGDNGILDLLASLSTETRNGLVDSARRIACTRFALHLRTSMG